MENKLVIDTFEKNGNNGRFKVERIIFRNPDNGYAVLAAEMEKTGPATLVGSFAGVRAGMLLFVEGVVTRNARFGRQIKVLSWTEVKPKDADGIREYLASGLVANIGRHYAKVLTDAFGDATLDVLENEPEKVLGVKGIGKKRAESIAAAMREQKAVREVFVWLKKYRLPNGLCGKIFQKYRQDSIKTLEENPYVLSDDLDGVGFKTADGVALSIGIDPVSPFRLRSGLLAVLKDETEKGNTWTGKDSLLRRAVTDPWLALSTVEGHREALSDALSDLEEDGLVRIQDDRVFLPYMLEAETKTANLLKGLLDADCKRIAFKAEEAQEATGYELSDGQKRAVETALTSGVCVITGGPGTGKTTVTKGIVAALEKADLHVELCAPTGRAAKRLSEATGRSASTIHRLLGCSMHGFEYCAENPLQGVDMILVDEASMVDILLAGSFLEAVKPGTRLVLVGDPDQLPPVGPGAFLRDVLDSGSIPCVRLAEIFRQAAKSRIVTAAHEINQGREPFFQNMPADDVKFVECEDPDEIRSRIDYLVSRKLPEMGYKADDVQVFSPTKKEGDPIGTSVINSDIQRLLNPEGKKVFDGENAPDIRIGDRVMQTKNNYTLGVFNGNIGVITGHDTENKKVKIEFDGDEVLYDYDSMKEIRLAYAVTVHKGQGSESPVTVIPVHPSHFVLLTRNLLYTAVTRAKKLCILIGTKEAVRLAVRRDDGGKRRTALKDFLIS